MLCRVLLVLMSLMLLQPYEAQNLVPNGSFEEFQECPDGVPSDFGVDHWIPSRYSYDNFSSCADEWVGVPSNLWGFQEAFDGDSYVGIATYRASSDDREHVLVELESPLTVGVTYYFSMFCSPSETWGIGTNGLGFMLTNTAYNHLFVDFDWVGNPSPVDRPTYAYPELISDTLVWTQVKASIVADSAYQYLVIGAFDGDFDTDTVHLTAGSQSNLALHFIDDVRLSTDSVFAFNEEPTSVPIKVLSGFNLFPNPFVDELILPESKMDLEAVDFYDVRGAKVHEAAIRSDRIQGLGFLEVGTYLLHFRGQKGTTGYSRVVKLE